MAPLATAPYYLYQPTLLIEWKKYEHFELQEFHLSDIFLVPPAVTQYMVIYKRLSYSTSSLSEKLIFFIEKEIIVILLKSMF